MGLTLSSTGKKAADTSDFTNRKSGERLVAIAGNPNVGKSTIFNGLTGMHQHTGNWPGKTVTNSSGNFSTEKSDYLIVDIPGTYSLLAHSPEEEVARNFLCFSDPEAVIAVCDATCLERNLNLVLQILEVNKKVLVCVNLLDEARRKGIEIDLKGLSKILGVPVIGTVGKNKSSIKEIKASLDGLFEKENNNVYTLKYPESTERAVRVIEDTLNEKFRDIKNSRWLSIKLLEGNPRLLKEIEGYYGKSVTEEKGLAESVKQAVGILSDSGIRFDKFSGILAETAVTNAEEIAKKVITYKNENYSAFDRKTDKILTSRLLGYPLMLVLLAIVFWITVKGANYISSALSFCFGYVEKLLCGILNFFNAPQLITEIVIEGIFRVPAWVVAVMLPPMAIFFPLFTLLEDVGYLPRIAFNLDKPFKRCSGCGKQALTMCMGFGCNAAGVVGCRIIDSKRERLMAVLTNSLVPCNGRFPALITVISIFLVSVPSGNLYSALFLTTAVLLGIFMTFFATKLLSLTVLKGTPSSYILEMPPYRKPRVGQVLVRSVFDRTLFVLMRSVTVAVPAGIIIWLMANIQYDGISLLTHCADFFDPFARLMGLDGILLMAFILGFPANEIVLPIAVMGYLGSGQLSEITSLTAVGEIFIANGWTPLTAVCTVIFTLFHWPCSTTLLTVKKETGSIKWMWIAFILPTAIGIALCSVITFVYRMLV